MSKFNKENERIKHVYLGWERDARGKAESTINNIRDTLYLFEEHTNFKSFKRLNKKDIISFKRNIEQKKNASTRQPVSKNYLLHTSKNLINFFQWLCCQPGYKSKISTTDIAYFNLSAKDAQIARSTPSKKCPTLEQIEHVVKNMPFQTDIQKRNRALIVFLVLSGGRVSAVASVKLKHVFLDEERVEQHPKEVKTKYSKKIITYFFPIGDFLKNIFVKYVHFLKHEKLFDNSAPLFPSTKLSLNANNQFSRQGLDATAWQSSTSIRTIVKEAFEAAGLDYYNPHSFRTTVAQLAYEYCKTPEEFKAWSQNLGHNSPLTTFMSYGTIDEFSQGKLIKELTKEKHEKSLTPTELKKIRRLLDNA